MRRRRSCGRSRTTRATGCGEESCATSPGQDWCESGSCRCWRECPRPESGASRPRGLASPHLRRVIVPVVHGSAAPAAIELALALAPEVVLQGLVRVGPDEALSGGAQRARETRRILRGLVDAAGGRARARARVRVSVSPWLDLQQVIRNENPDVLVLEWPTHFLVLDADVDQVLAAPACDTLIVRGPLPHQDPKST